MAYGTSARRHDAERVDLALARAFHPFACAEAERAERRADTSAPSCTPCSEGAKISRLHSHPRTACVSGLVSAVPTKGIFALDIGHVDHSRSRITVLPPCRVPSEPPVPCASARLQFFTCTAGCASPRSWRTASMILVMPPRFAGWLLHKPAAVGVERQLADTGDQVAVGDEFSALPLLAEAEVLQLHQHGDGEAVVDRGVFDVGRLDARHLPRRRAGPAGGRIDQIDVAAHLVLRRLTDADDLHQWPFQAFARSPAS